MSFAIQHSYLIPLLPLVAAVVIGLFGAKVLKGGSHWPVWISVGVSAVLSLVLLLGMLGELRASTEGAASILQGKNFVQQTWFTWFTLGSTDRGNFHFNLTAGVLIDALSVTMLCVVTVVGLLITVFAAGYMKGEAGYWRFFAYVGLFISAMTILVLGDNLILLYLGWEGVGLCSYLLIGYYYQKAEAREAARKAFIVNRIGDLGFLVGILLTYHCFGTVSFFGDSQNPGFVTQASNGFALVNQEKLWLVQLIPLCLMIGALGKSAQFPLFVWLPDAMAGPTPVSALIHAATMVTAGVYLCVRTSPLFYSFEWILITLGVLGSFTAVFAGTISLRQYDLKKDFAYSTCSQLGFMFVAFAALSPVAAIFHLITHAFFKALLFLGSGVVSHSTGGVLDMRRMSGLKTYLPKTRWLMLIGCSALAGVPLITAGYYSKDAILVTSFKHSLVLGVLMLASAFMTAYYTFRLYFRVFEGPTVIPEDVGQPHDDDRGDAPGNTHNHSQHNHEPWIMILPLVLLAVGSLFTGFIDYPHRHVSLGTFLGTSPSLATGYQAAESAFPGQVPPIPFGQAHLEAGRPPEKIAKEHALHLYMMIGSGVLALLGIAAASYYHLFNREALGRLSRQFGSVTHVLEAKYFVDEIYQTLFVNPYRSLAGFAQIIDYVIDGVVFIVGLVPQAAGATLRYTTQRGYLQGYAMTVLLGLAVILAMMFL